MGSESIGVLLLDDRRVFVAVNEPASELLRSSIDELVGRRADDFMPLIARALYPAAWQGFLLRGSADGDYAAQLGDGSLRRLAYVGFANRPIRGLHFFVLRGLDGDLRPEVLLPRRKDGFLQVGAQLPPDLRQRLHEEADREEWRLPVRGDAERAIVAALFDRPEDAVEALDAVRALGTVDASLAIAAGSTTTTPLTLLAGRMPYTVVGSALEQLRHHHGRIMATVDERWTR